MRRAVLAFVAIVLVLVAVGWSIARAQETPGPGESGYFQDRISRLLATSTDERAPDQMFRLLMFLWADSMTRAGTLILDPRLETDQTLQAQLIAETGVWEAVYRAAQEIPPLTDPQFAPVQDPTLEAMQLSMTAATDIRDYAMTGNEESLLRAVSTIEAGSELIAPHIP